MKKKPVVINIGDTDENADWIKTDENRASETAIHAELARRIEEMRKRRKDERQDV